MSAPKLFVLMLLGLGLFSQSSYAFYPKQKIDWMPAAENISAEEALLEQAANIIALAASAEDIELGNATYQVRFNAGEKQKLNALFKSPDDVSNASLVFSFNRLGIPVPKKSQEAFDMLKTLIKQEKLSLASNGAYYSVRNDGGMIARFYIDEQHQAMNAIADPEEKKQAYHQYFESNDVIALLESISLTQGGVSRKDFYKMRTLIAYLIDEMATAENIERIVEWVANTSDTHAKELAQNRLKDYALCPYADLNVLIKSMLQLDGYVGFQELSLGKQSLKDSFTRNKQLLSYIGATDTDLLLSEIFRSDLGCFEEGSIKNLLSKVEALGEYRCSDIDHDYVQNSEADPAVIKEMLDEAEAFNTFSPRPVWQGCLQNPSVDADTHKAILAKDKEKLDETQFINILGAYLRNPDPDPVVMGDVLQQLAAYPLNSAAYAYQVYMKNPAADSAMMRKIIEKAKDEDLHTYVIICRGYLENPAADPGAIKQIFSESKDLPSLFVSSIYASYLANPAANFAVVRDILAKAADFENVNDRSRVLGFMPLAYSHYLDREGTDSEMAQELIAEMQATLLGRSILDEVYARKRNKKGKSARKVVPHKRQRPEGMVAEPEAKKQKTS